jgi:hypothetical protein
MGDEETRSLADEEILTTTADQSLRRGVADTDGEDVDGDDVDGTDTNGSDTDGTDV